MGLRVGTIDPEYCCAIVSAQEACKRPCRESAEVIATSSGSYTWCETGELEHANAVQRRRMRWHLDRICLLWQ